VCTDCSGLTGQNCADHSGACCLDAGRTANPADDICRGGDGQLITNDPSQADFGYCGYYKCSVVDPSQCASDDPVKLGDFISLDKCITGCQDNIDPCSALTTLTDCQKDSRCCFDDKIVGTEKCRLGDKIVGGSDEGYCARYDCAATDPITCAADMPTKSGLYDNLDSCLRYCGSEPIIGQACVSRATSTCATDKCNFPGFDCLSPLGTIGGESSDCGTCCCQPNAPVDSCELINPSLQCLPDKGNCSGTERGLCCGCSGDAECGSVATIGCGSDTCCQARPQMIDSLPRHLDSNVCRNSIIKVDFDQLMDPGSFVGNVLLFEERDYGNGVCPAGTFLTKGDSLNDVFAKEKNFFTRLFGRLNNFVARVKNSWNGDALATPPSASKLYCATPGVSYGQNDGDKTSLIFAPQKLLSAAANYYLVILGDANLDSQSGVLSLSQIGFNGDGYEGQESVTFNGKNYKNSKIIEFSTLSAQSPMSGVCAIDLVKIQPDSYLFNKSENGLDENDSNPQDKTFDTQADKDKAFIAHALSVDGQILQPVTGYFWDWDFAINDASIASIVPVNGLSANRSLISAISGVTDGETQAVATVNMDRFAAGSCTAGNCSCSDERCSNKCCNAFMGGDGFNASSNLYVFLCENPWPPVQADGAWSPWVDTCEGAQGNNCADYNYKFYYCRDAGDAGTLDDLPAIINQAVIRGQSSNFACSSDRSPCSNLNAACGSDQNGDGQADGICVWNILKESYFFREAIPLSGEISSATDLKTGGEVAVAWTSSASLADSYKIYYLKSGRGDMAFKEVKASDACSLIGGVYDCQAQVSGLTNGLPYVFKVSVISVNKTESELSNDKTATPTDQTPPAVPTGLKLQVIASTTVQFNWQANSDDASFYRLYRGIDPGLYGESFDSAPNITTISLPFSNFSGNNYFALTALDASGNESGKSSAISLSLGGPAD
jgi:hypothetical protein